MLSLLHLGSTDCTYTTEITLFIKDDDKIIKRINYQIDELDGELLLFLNYSRCLEIAINDHVTKFKRINKRNGAVIEKYIDEVCVEKVEWCLDIKKGVYNSKNYSIIVAYRKDGELPRRQVVYCYLPTDIDMPLPLLLHANFELDGTRNHLIKHSTANAHILDIAVDTIINSAIEQTRRSKTPSFAPLKMLIPMKNMTNTELSGFGFWDKLLKKASKSKLLPTVNGEYIDASAQPVSYDKPIAKYLNGENFDNLLIYTEDESVLKYLSTEPFGRYHYVASFFSECVNNWAKNRKYSEKHAEENSLLIQAIITDSNAEHEGLNLLYGQDGLLATENNPAFVKADNGMLRLPSFIRIKRIDPYMKDVLTTIFECDEEDLVDELNGYNIAPFSMLDIIKRMEYSIDTRLTKKDIKRAKECVQESLEWLWENKDELFKLKLDEISFKMITRNGNVEDSRKLYLGQEYGVQVVEDLMIGFPGDIFLAKNGFDVSNSTELKSFYCYLGVAAKPRDIYSEVDSYEEEMKDFAEFVWKTAQYPIHCEEWLMNAHSSNKHFIGKLHSIENLDWILKKSSTDSILRWIQSDKNIKEILESKIDRKTEFKATFDNLTKPRDVERKDIPPYILWKFKTLPWVEIKNKRYRVSDCIFEEVPSELSNVLVKPDLSEYSSSESGPNTNRNNEYKKILLSIGVMDAYKDLPNKKLYDFLISLSDYHDTKYAKSFYSKIYDTYDERKISDSERQRFVKKGKILCKDGNYYPIQDCQYLDRRAFCRLIRERYHLIEMRTRLRSNRIMSIFGVPRLDIKGELVGEPSIHEIDSFFQKDFDHYKACVVCYRYGNNISKERTEINKLKNLKIVICESVDALIGGEQVVLDNYDYVMQNNNTYYLKVPVTMRPDNLYCHDMGDAVSGIICDVFDLLNERTSLRDLYMKSVPDRERAVQDEVEDENILIAARQELGSRLNSKEEFVDILSDNTNIESSILANYVEKIDFTDINSFGNGMYIIDLFKQCDFDIAEYNDNSILSKLTLEDYYSSLISKYKRKYKKKAFHTLDGY